MPHASPMPVAKTFIVPPKAEAFRSFVEGLERFREYLQTDTGTDLKAAEAAFKVAVAVDPTFEFAEFYRAITLAHLRQADAAIDALEGLSERDVRFQAEVHYYLAYAYARKYELWAFEKSEAAIDQAEASAKSSKNNALLLLCRAFRVYLYGIIAGREYGHKESFEQRRDKYLPLARKLGEELLKDSLLRRIDQRERHGVLVEARNGLGIVYMRLSEGVGLSVEESRSLSETAAGHFKECLALQPRNVSALQNMGTLLLIRGRQFSERQNVKDARKYYRDALGYYLRSSRINPFDRFPHYRAAIACGLLGDWEKARQHLQSARKHAGAVSDGKLDKLELAIERRDSSQIHFD